MLEFYTENAGLNAKDGDQVWKICDFSDLGGNMSSKPICTKIGDVKETIPQMLTQCIARYNNESQGARIEPFYFIYVLGSVCTHIMQHAQPMRLLLAGCADPEVVSALQSLLQYFEVDCGIFALQRPDLLAEGKAAFEPCYDPPKGFFDERFSAVIADTRLCKKKPEKILAAIDKLLIPGGLSCAVCVENTKLRRWVGSHCMSSGFFPGLDNQFFFRAWIRPDRERSPAHRAAAQGVGIEYNALLKDAEKLISGKPDEAHIERWLAAADEAVLCAERLERVFEDTRDWLYSLELKYLAERVINSVLDVRTEVTMGRGRVGVFQRDLQEALERFAREMDMEFGYGQEGQEAN